MRSDGQNYEGPAVDKDWWKIWRNRRYVLAFMVFFGMINMYACRVNLSVAIVAMTKNTTLVDGTQQAADFSWSSSQRGIILSSFFYGYVPTQTFIGVLLSKISAHIVFGFCTAMSGVLTLLMPLIATYLPFWVIVVTRVLTGVFQSVCIPCIMTFWAHWAPPLERSRMHGIVISGGYMGTVLALPISGLLGQYLGWESIFYVIGSVSIIWYVIWLILIRESPEKDNFMSKAERDYILKAIGEKKQTQTPPIPWSSISVSLPLWGIVIAGFSWGWGYVTMLTQLPLFLSDVMEFDLGKNGFLSSLPYITMTIMSLLAGFITDQILVKRLMTVTQTRKYFISVSLIFQAIFIVVAAYITEPVWNILCIIIGIGIGAIAFSAISINYIDIAPVFAAVVGGIGNTFSTCPGILSPLITGFIVKSDEAPYDELVSQWRVIFFIVAGMYVIGAISYWFMGSATPQIWATCYKPPANGFDIKIEQLNHGDNKTKTDL